MTKPLKKGLIIKRILIPLFFCSFFLCGQALSSQYTHTVFFEGEENELHVYRIKGTQPGKTLLIIGGIQGDEPGGYLAADFYADFLLEKGNLIVVPRANFPSILKMDIPAWIISSKKGSVQRSFGLNMYSLSTIISLPVSSSIILYFLRHSCRQAPRWADVLVCRRLMWQRPLWAMHRAPWTNTSIFMSSPDGPRSLSSLMR